MLHKNRSKNKNQWKFALILPLIAAFIFTFNTKIVAQNPVKETQEVKVLKKVKEVKVVKELTEVTVVKEVKDVKELEVVVERIKIVEIEKNHELHEVHDNIEAFIITKDAKNLDKIQKELSEKGVTVKFKNIKRNDKGEITSIKIDLKSKTASANFSMNSDTPIKSIKITIEDDGSKLSIGTISNSHNIFFNKKGENVLIIEKKHGNHELHEIIIEDDKQLIIEIKEGKHKNHKVFEIKEDDGNNVLVIRKEGELHEIKTDGDHVKKLWVSKEDNKVIEIIKKDGNSNIFISSDGTSPLIIIDGKESTTNLEDLDTGDFESISVLKGDKAIEKYGAKAKDGVIEIITKKK